LTRFPRFDKKALFFHKAWDLPWKLGLPWENPRWWLIPKGVHDPFEEAKIAVVPGSVFGEFGYDFIKISYFYQIQ